MATIRQRGNSYQIRVSSGYDLKGKQIIKTLTYVPPEGFTPKQIEREVERQKVLFEKKISDGLYLNSSITFSDFAERWMKDYVEKQLAPKTIQRYRTLLDRVNPAIGHIKLDKIQPQHLLAFYDNLGDPGMRLNGRHLASTKLIKLLKKDVGKIALNSGVSARTIKGIAKGKATNLTTVKKLLSALNTSDKTLFTTKSTSLSPRTIQYYHRFISSVLSTAVQWQILFSNPCERVKPPKAKSKEALYLDEVQARKVIELLAKEDMKYKTAITLLIYSGLRRGELCGLEWSDIEFKNEVIHVRRSSQYLPGEGIFAKAPKNESSLRTIKLNSDIFTLLAQYKKWQNVERLKCGDLWINSDRLFTQWNGKPISPDTFTQWFHKWIAKNDLPPICIHSLRHTNATLLISGGVSIRTVADMLGHAQTSTTSNIYAHAIQSASAAASEILKDMLNPVNNKHA